MLYNFLVPLADDAQFFNLFRYLTFRSGGALMTALVVSFFIGPWVIRTLKSRQKDGQPIRMDGPESHLLTKRGTPTMGGVMIIFSVLLSTLLWADITNVYIWTVLAVFIAYGLLGMADDYAKLTKKTSDGISGKAKLITQLTVAMAAGYVAYKVSPAGMETHLALPFFKDLLINLSVLYLPFVMIVIVGSSNAVNLTDGLDGLAIVPVMIAAASFGLIAYLTGNVIYSGYLQLHMVPGTGELTVFCAALIGAGLGFLWFNAPPAMVFMGDTGSLSIGGALGTIAVLVKHEIVLAVIGGLFVLEAVSVIIQVVSFKLTGKRVFKMAPIHHHFEKQGWQESTIVVRFWIIAVILALIGLSTLKLR